MPESTSSKHSRWPWVVLLLIILFAAAIRIRLADMPLERDEGEYAYAGQLILHGVPPYKLAYNMKLPGTYAAYATMMLFFGETTRGIHLGMAVVNAATILLVFLLGRKLFDSIAGVVAAATFAVMSNSVAFLAQAAHANHFVILFAVAGLLVLLYAQGKRPRWFFWAGLLLGLSFLMKQQGSLFIVFGGMTILWSGMRQRPWNWRGLIQQLVFWGMGCVVPFLLTCLILWATGVFEKFWFWTFRYAQEYVSMVPAKAAFGIFWRSFTPILEFTWPIWLLALLGLNLMVIVPSARRSAGWLVGLILFSSVAVSLGFYFRPHYYLLLVPAICLAVGAFGSLLCQILPQSSLYKGISLVIFASAFGGEVYLHKESFFQQSPVELSADIYGGNPFFTIDSVSRYIRANSSKDASIAVLGSEPEVYFQANRRSATGYIYMYGLMEPHPFALEMQKEMIREIEAAAPEYVVLVKMDFSWLVRRDSHELILNWLNEYTAKLYEPEGVLQFNERGECQEMWVKDGRLTPPTSDQFIIVFHRKAATQINKSQQP